MTPHPLSISGVTDETVLNITGLPWSAPSVMNTELPPLTPLNVNIHRLDTEVVSDCWAIHSVTQSNNSWAAGQPALCCGFLHLICSRKLLLCRREQSPAGKFGFWWLLPFKSIACPFAQIIFLKQIFNLWTNSTIIFIQCNSVCILEHQFTTECDSINSM